MTPPSQLNAQWHFDKSNFHELLTRSQAGDALALEALVQRFYPTVRDMVHRSLARDIRFKRPWLGALFSTGDVVQEVFTGVLKGLSAVDCKTDDAFTGYLAMVVHNRLVDAIRFHQAARRDGRRSTDLATESAPPSAEPGPLSSAISLEQVRIFELALGTFSDRERLLLRQRLEQAETFPNLAENLAYPSPDAARQAFYTARARLLVVMERGGLSGERPTS